jgi:uncharacterized protein
MLYYLDSSALIKRYAPEAGTAWIKQLFDPALANQAYFSQVTGIEVAAGLSRKVRTKEVSSKYYELVLQLFLDDLDRGNYNAVPLNDEMVKLAIDLTKRHPLRAYDALHLATAKTLNSALMSAKLSPITFVAADASLLTAAQSEELSVEDPSLH